jgi:hypothetical protein
MSIKEDDRQLMDEHHRTAVMTLQAERIREQLEYMLERFVVDTVYDTGGGFPDNYGGYLQDTIRRLLDSMFSVCPPDAWAMIGKPVMDKYYAEQTHNLMMSQLVMESLTKPVVIPSAIEEMLRAHNARISENAGETQSEPDAMAVDLDTPDAP